MTKPEADYHLYHERYVALYKKLVDLGYEDEIKWAESLKPCSRASVFAQEAIWVILNSGMKNQVATKLYRRILTAVIDRKPISSVFRHEGKGSAISYILSSYPRLFNEYKEVTDKLAYLETLPWIGKITKYHLGKNLGLEVIKPDRHLVRIANSYHMTPLELCTRLSEYTGHRIVTVDTVLWRSANLGLI